MSRKQELISHFSEEPKTQKVKHKTNEEATIEAKRSKEPCSLLGDP